MRITMARRLYVSFDRNCPLRLHLVVAFVPTYLKLKSSCVPSISREFELRRNGNCVVSLCDLARQIPHTREVIGALSSDFSMATEDHPMEGALAPENERSPSPAPPRAPLAPRAGGGGPDDARARLRRPLRDQRRRARPVRRRVRVTRGDHRGL